MRYLLFLSIFFSFNSWCGEPKWELMREQMGIKVYKKIYENSSLIAFRGVGVIKAPIQVVANTILNENREGKLSDALLETKTLEWIKYPNEYIEYNEIEMPLWITNRDFVSKVFLTYNKKRKELTVAYNSSLKYQTPINKDNILGDINGSSYTLTSIDNGKQTLADGTALADPKGSIPKWFVNIFQASWPYETLQLIRKHSIKTDPISKHIKDVFK